MDDLNLNASCDYRNQSFPRTCCSMPVFFFFSNCIFIHGFIETFCLSNREWKVAVVWVNCLQYTHYQINRNSPKQLVSLKYIEIKRSWAIIPTPPHLTPSPKGMGAGLGWGALCTHITYERFQTTSLHEKWECEIIKKKKRWRKKAR